MTEERMQYRVPVDERWVFVLNREGRATNVRVLRGTTVIEILHKGERMLVDVCEIAAIEVQRK